MPPKTKSKKNKQDHEVTTRSTDDTDCVIAPVADVPGFPLFLHQKFRSLPKSVRELVYGHLDMCTAHSASLACSEIHNYFVEHPLTVDKIEVSLVGDTEARQTIDVRYPTEGYTETHCRTFNSSPQPLTVTLEKSKLPFPTIQSLLATHNMNMSSATVVHGIQITQTETITVDLLTLLCCSPRDVTPIPITHRPKNLVFNWLRRKKKVAKSENDSSKKINSGVGDLTEGQILHGIQAWIDFVRPTDEVILQVEDASIVIPTGFFGLSGIKAAAGVTIRMLNPWCADNRDNDTVPRERRSTSSVIVNVTMKQIRKLTASKLVLGFALRITAEEVVQWFMQKINDWVRIPTASLHYSFARPLDDKAYDEKSIVRELNLSRLAPRFVVHNTESLRMRTSPLYPVSDVYGVGTIIRDTERPRALFVGCGPRIFVFDEAECHEIVWEEKSTPSDRLKMPVAGWPTKFPDFRTLPKAVREVIYSQLGFADAQSLCAVHPAAREYYREHPFVGERVRLEYTTPDGMATSMTDRSTFSVLYGSQVRFERHEHLCFFDLLLRHRPGHYSVDVEPLEFTEPFPGFSQPFKGLVFKHALRFNESMIFDGLSRVEAQEIFVNFLSILSASPPMEMAPHQRPPQVLILLFGALQTDLSSILHEYHGQPVGMTLVDLCKQPEKAIEGMRRWLHFIQPTFKLVLRMENQQQILPQAIFDIPEVRAAKGLVTDLDSESDGRIYDVHVDVTIAQVRALSATYIFLGHTPQITDRELFSYVVDKIRAWLADRNPTKTYNYCFARNMDMRRTIVYVNEIIAVLELGDRFRVHDLRTVWPAGADCFGFYGTLCGKIIQDTQIRRALLVGCGPGPRIHSLTDEQLREVNWGARDPTVAGRGSGTPLDSCVNQ